MREEKIKKLIEVKNNENWECLLKLIDYSLIYIAIYTIKKLLFELAYMSWQTYDWITIILHCFHLTNFVTNIYKRSPMWMCRLLYGTTFVFTTSSYVFESNTTYVFDSHTHAWAMMVGLGLTFTQAVNACTLWKLSCISFYWSCI